jgi:hypothetical protein
MSGTFQLTGFDWLHTGRTNLSVTPMRWLHIKVYVVWLEPPWVCMSKHCFLPFTLLLQPQSQISQSESITSFYGSALSSPGGRLTDSGHTVYYQKWLFLYWPFYIWWHSGRAINCVCTAGSTAGLPEVAPPEQVNTSDCIVRSIWSTYEFRK